MSDININQAFTTRYKKGAAYFTHSILVGRPLKCSPGYIGGRCKRGHRYAAPQFCGREYCQDCSRDGSPIHQRRVKNAWNRYKSKKSLGYLVVTVPRSVRYLFDSKEVLRDFRFKVLRFLKDKYGFNEGLCRWHWFGDCKKCGGNGCEGCNNTGAGDEWYPHLNILIPGLEFIHNVDEYLTPIRAYVKKYFLKLIDQDMSIYAEIIRTVPPGIDITEFLGLYDNLQERRRKIEDNKKMVVNYSYANKPAKIMNFIKYVTRSTFRIYDSVISERLHNFRNIVVWGWKKGQDLEREEKIIFCPECEKDNIKNVIKWTTLQKYSKHITIKKQDYDDDERRKKTIYRLHYRDSICDRASDDGIHRREPSTIFYRW